MKLRQLSAVCLAALLAGCSATAASSTSSASASSTTETVSVSSSITLDTEDTIETWDDSSAVQVTLNGDSASFEGSNISESSQVITITSAGTYVFTGTYNGSIEVSCAAKNGTVRIILNGVTINASKNSAVNITKATKVIITAASGTDNVLSDTDNYELNSDDEPTACIFSKDDLVINGSGTLTVNGNYNDGITGKDDLYLINTNITVTSADDGIIGKDTLYILNSDITVNAQGDALKASNETDAGKGSVIIDSGTLDLTAGDDGIQGVTAVSINGGTINIKAGDGYTAAAAHTDSMQMGGFNQNKTSTDTTDSDTTEKSKGITVTGNLVINDGTLSIDAQDDALHANGNITMAAGSVSIYAGDDGAHADGSLQIDGGTMNILSCYEGLEGMNIILNGGDISITASDDGINGSNPSDSADMSDDGSTLVINGGTISVTAGGDGIDMNGSGTMNGGTVTVYGSSDSGNGALDYNGTFNVNGGTLLAGGASGMAQTPSDTSTCYTINIGTSSGTITIQDASGNEIASYASSKSYQVLCYTSDVLQSGETYTVYENGTSLGTVTISSKTTSLNASSQNSMGGGMGQGGKGQGGGTMPGGQTGGTNSGL